MIKSRVIYQHIGNTVIQGNIPVSQLLNIHVTGISTPLKRQLVQNSIFHTIRIMHVRNLTTTELTSTSCSVCRMTKRMCNQTFRKGEI